MRLALILASLILASSILGYGFASAQTTPCTASHPCIKICGDHPCAAGEVYSTGVQSSKTNSTVKTGTSTNGTITSSMVGSMNKTSMNMTNVNGTKIQNMTGFSYLKNSTMSSTGTMTKMNQTKGMYANGTKSTTGMMEKTKGKASGKATTSTGTTGAMAKNKGMSASAPGHLSPKKQIDQGVSPSNVQCQSGYQLILNKFDSRPACVSPTVLKILEDRGWGKS